MSGSVRAEMEHEIGRLTRTDIVRYAGASGDFTRVHHDEPHAKELGFPSVYAMGMLPAGVLVEVVRTWVGLDAIAGMKLRFSSMTWPDTNLVVHASLHGTAEAVSVDAEMRADGHVVVTAAIQLTDVASHEWSNRNV